MKLTDLLIIYFAFGAPFGVYQITTAQDPLDTKAVLQIVLRIICWPVFAILILIERFSNSSNVIDSSGDRRIDEIRLEIEGLVFENDVVSSIFDFREILHRYVGLSEAAMEEVTSNPANEIFEISNSKNKDLASACLARKNLRKLSFQHSLVRNEFIDMISGFALDGEKRVRIMALAVELADRVTDPFTANALATMSEPNEPVKVVAQMPEYEVSLVN